MLVAIGIWPGTNSEGFPLCTIGKFTLDDLPDVLQMIAEVRADLAADQITDVTVDTTPFDVCRRARVRRIHPGEKFFDCHLN